MNTISTAAAPAAQPAAPLPLFAWAARQPRPAPVARLVLRDDLRDADGAPRACIVIPGRRAPLAFPTIAEALAALQRMEAAHAGR
jgi:hypothetical protein